MFLERRKKKKKSNRNTAEQFLYFNKIRPDDMDALKVYDEGGNLDQDVAQMEQDVNSQVVAKHLGLLAQELVGDDHNNIRPSESLVDSSVVKVGLLEEVEDLHLHILAEEASQNYVTYMDYHVVACPERKKNQNQ